MEQKLLSRKHRTIFLAAVFSVAGVFFGLRDCIAAEPEQSGNVLQIEATVIHVDQYAVYAPNLIFYFDAKMEKKKINSLMRMADQLRNKKAVITYSSASEPGQEKHNLLLDITPVTEKFSAEKAPREAPGQPADNQVQPSQNLPRQKAAPSDDEQAEPPRSPPPQPALREEKLPRAPGEFIPITRQEVTVFVRRLLELNERKDLAAVTPFYADKVDYYDRGVVTRDYVMRDLAYYFRNWDRIMTSLDGDVVLIVLDQPEVRIAKFISSFSVRNEKRALAGKTENIWKIQRINGKLKLIDVKQRIISRESSDM